MNRVVAALEMPAATPHDLHRTGATLLTSERIGIPRSIVSQVIAHAADTGGAAVVTGRHYGLNDYLPEKRRALDAWAALLSEIVGGKVRASNVSQLRVDAAWPMPVASQRELLPVWWTPSQADIAPGKSMQNGYVEPFNGRMRDELLNESLFFGFDHARQAIAVWVADYSTARPHSSLAYQAPAAYADHLTATGHRATPLGSSAWRPVAHPAPQGVSMVEALIAAG